MRQRRAPDGDAIRRAAILKASAAPGRVSHREFLTQSEYVGEGDTEDTEIETIFGLREMVDQQKEEINRQAQIRSLHLSETIFEAHVPASDYAHSDESENTTLAGTDGSNVSDKSSLTSSILSEVDMMSNEELSALIDVLQQHLKRREENGGEGSSQFVGHSSFAPVKGPLTPASLGPSVSTNSATKGAEGKPREGTGHKSSSSNSKPSSTSSSRSPATGVYGSSGRKKQSNLSAAMSTLSKLGMPIPKRSMSGDTSVLRAHQQEALAAPLKSKSKPSSSSSSGLSSGGGGGGNHISPKAKKSAASALFASERHGAAQSPNKMFSSGGDDIGLLTCDVVPVPRLSHSPPQLTHDPGVVRKLAPKYPPEKDAVADLSLNLRLSTPPFFEFVPEFSVSPRTAFDDRSNGSSRSGSNSAKSSSSTAPMDARSVLSSRSLDAAKSFHSAEEPQSSRAFSSSPLVSPSSSVRASKDRW